MTLLGVVASGCATTTSVVRPSPFPGRATATRTSPAHTSRASAVLERALALRGTPYRPGGDRPETGLDCSGLVRYVFLEVQVRVPRTVVEQFNVGLAVNAADIQPGDLLFFDTAEPGPSHVGIALNAITFVHAPGSGGFVRLDQLAAPYWSARLRGIRRLLLASDRDTGISSEAQ